MLFRSHMIACSAVTAGTYGSVASAIPKEDLDAMYKMSMQAIWRGAAFAANEVLSCFFIPWRANPIAIAVVSPWQYIRSAVQRGICTSQRLRSAWEVCTDYFVGPLSSLRQSLRLAGLEGSPDVLSSVHLPHTINPLTTTTHALRSFLLQSLRAKELSGLAKFALSLLRYATFFLRAISLRNMATEKRFC